MPLAKEAGFSPTAAHGTTADRTIAKKPKLAAERLMKVLLVSA
jgi:hypothetical protein